MAWTCPDCKRSFGRRNQSHECAPSGTVDEFFEGRPRGHRTTYNAVERCIKRFKDATVDPVKVCIMFKRSRTFAEVRLKRDCVVLYFLLSREVIDPRITKRMRLSAHRTAHVVELVSPGDVDRAVRDWLAEAYACSPVT